MRFYYVNPANTADITGPYREGQTGVTLPDGRNISRINGAVPEWGLYEATEDNTSTPEYYTLERVDLVFQGSVGSAAARVVETNVFEQIPIEELYNVKRQEIRDQDDDVRYNAVDTSLSSAWWVVITEKAQQELLWIATGSNSRQFNVQPWPSGPNTPVAAVYNSSNQRVRREAITSQAVWDTIEQEIALHLQATSNATKLSGDTLDDTYDNGNGDWNAVAAHDAADPIWGYPPTVNGALMREALNSA